MKYCFFILILVVLMGISGCEKIQNNISSTETSVVSSQNSNTPLVTNMVATSQEKIANMLYNEFIDAINSLEELSTSKNDANTSYNAEYTVQHIRLVDLITGVDVYKDYLSDNDKNGYSIKRKQIVELIMQNVDISQDIMPVYSYYSTETGDHLIVISSNEYNYFTKQMESFYIAYDYIRQINDEGQLFSDLYANEGNGGAFTNILDVFYENLYDNTISKEVIPILITDDTESKPKNDYSGPYSSDKEIFESYNRDFYTGSSKMKSGNWRLFGFDVISENATVKISIDGKTEELKNYVQ